MAGLTWAQACAHLNDGQKVQRNGWRLHYVAKVDGGPLLALYYGGYMQEQPWSPSAIDRAATDWQIVPRLAQYRVSYPIVVH